MESASTSRKEDLNQQCVLCKKSVDPQQKDWTKLKKYGVIGIQRCSLIREDNLSVAIGNLVHKSCRSKYINTKLIAQKLKKKKQDIVFSPKKFKLRSNSSNFDYRKQCLFCCQTFMENEKNIHKVLSRHKYFDRSILKACNMRNDRWACQVKSRICFVSDLHAVDARYHASCDSTFRCNWSMPNCRKSLTNGQLSKNKRGRPLNTDRENLFLDSIDYIKNSNEEIIILESVLENLNQKLTERNLEKFQYRYFKEKVIMAMQDEIAITHIRGKYDIVTYKSNVKKILNEFFKSERGSPDEVKLDLMRAAGNIILSDIKCIDRDMDNYPSTISFDTIEKCLDYLPTTLKCFLSALLSRRTDELKICSIGQALVQAVLPRSVTAPLQIGLGIQMHRRYGSKYIIETLNQLGFSSSYHEIQKFEKSAAYHQGCDIPGLTGDSFVQFMADNVDHNLCTLDGANTFHGMGIIASITPKVDTHNVTPKCTITNEELITVNKIKILNYYKDPQNPGLKFMTLPGYSFENSIHWINLLWKTTWLLNVDNPKPLWNGFMKTIHKTGDYPGQSSIILLPMIDMKASDESTIYSTMYFVADQCQKYDLSPILTFDQPLYQKALDIISNLNGTSSLKNIILRLGGLHTCMSYLGAIGSLMTHTGLQQIMETIYAEHTVPHMLSGKAISRSIRCHLIVSGVLTYLVLNHSIDENNNYEVLEDYECQISLYEKVSENQQCLVQKNESNSALQSCEITIDSDNALPTQSNEQFVPELERLYDIVCKGGISPDNLINHPTLYKLKDKLHTFKNSMNSRTAQLFLLYIDMVEILCSFIAAERTGNFHLHLQSLAQMLPFLAASGHHLYTKSAYLYLQNMYNLEHTNPNVYRKFLCGYHVVRRSDQFWSGLSTDLVIEQVLMRSLKSNGGMTRGRGMSEFQRAVWVLSTPACAEFNDTMEKITGVEHRCSEQHKENSNSRLKRDQQDGQKVHEYLVDRNPFTMCDKLVNIHTGEIAGDSVNVDQAELIGKKIIAAMQGQDVKKYKFKRSEAAVVMKSNSTVKVDNSVINVDPQLLFQRIITSVQGIGCDIEMEHIFSFELSTYPSSLVDNDGLLREADKSQLAKSIWNESLNEVQQEVPQNCAQVLDGGSLLHRISWQKGQYFGEIINKYTNYVLENFKNATVVFDSYINKHTTKSLTHFRRSNGFTNSPGIIVSRNAILNVKKEEFLMNEKNKQNFIKLLSEDLESNGIITSHATDDADLLIALTALKKAETIPTIIIGEDTDLLVLLIHYVNNKSNNLCNIVLKSDKRDASKIWTIDTIIKKLGVNIASVILPIHALLGCDTTSRIYSIGKGAAFKKCKTDPQFRKFLLIFVDGTSSKEDIVEAGEKLLLILYGGGKAVSLDQLRLWRYNNKVATSNKCLKPEMLCPTSDAASFHSLRVYHQVQTWMGANLNPLEFGWKISRNKLLPIYTTKPPAPASLLKMIRCNCKGDCTSNSCTCHRYSLRCSIICGHCKGVSCNNGFNVDEDDSYE